MNLNLDQLEAKIQSLVESQLTGLLPGLKLEDRIIQKLAVALKQNVIEQKNKGALAPNVYTLIVAVGRSLELGSFSGDVPIKSGRCGGLS